MGGSAEPGSACPLDGVRCYTLLANIALSDCEFSIAGCVFGREARVLDFCVQFCNFKILAYLEKIKRMHRLNSTHLYPVHEKNS